MTDHEEPTTEAGRRLLERIRNLNGRSFPLATAQDILAIESEARATAERRMTMTQNQTTEPTVDLPFPTTDARKWAAEFVRLHGGDEGLMLSWFANAIEHGRGPSEARATAPAGLREAAQRVVAIQTDGGYRSELNKAVDDLRAALAADSEPVE